ncbi:MAG: GTPase Era [Proteobacteria bacterium]|uniref:GTPase Era n=1 Tax=Candidatus Fonsibacter lacus TaxID=2576439 RepID=A0A964UYT1_9PROT|nr:GTPase Era [Candidatus Fonsibacter lacus]NBP59847.1 GTPase Era [Pseudomonadota bacterium]
MNKKRIGYACLIGPTNAGKSTLLNAIFKKKISIVSHKVQTTNFAIEVVKNHKDNKIICIDTPGLYNKKNNTNFINDVNVEVKRSDVIVIILDISIHLFYEEILEKIIKSTKKPKILVFNKIDKVSQEFAIEQVNKSNFVKNFDEIYYVSALKNKNINNLLDGIVAKLPEGNFDNSINFETNISKDVFFSELTREAIFKYLNQELPYQIYVKTYKFEKEKRNYKIYQIIYVKNDNHKKIVLGKNGNVIKKIGIAARKEIEKLFKHKVSLFLDVQTSKQ